MITHGSLCTQAEKFLERSGFGVVFRDEYRASVSTGEQPDSIGFRNGVSCLIECKMSRSDFFADKKKKFRMDNSIGMGDWRFFMTPKGLITINELPEGWGLLETDGKRVYKTLGWPPNSQWYSAKPFFGNKEVECQYMYGALRRMVIRGHFKEIYTGVPN